MKENNEEIKPLNSFTKTLSSKTNTNKSGTSIELEDKNSLLKRESETSFNKALLNKVQKEEEEKMIKRKLKEARKILKQLTSLSRKDYLVFFSILISCGLNYNPLLLPFLIISLIYFSKFFKVKTESINLYYVYNKIY